jgi:hypothetical protein
LLGSLTSDDWRRLAPPHRGPLDSRFRGHDKLALQNQHFSCLFLVSHQRREAIQGCIT